MWNQFTWRNTPRLRKVGYFLPDSVPLGRALKIHIFVSPAARLFRARRRGVRDSQRRTHNRLRSPVFRKLSQVEECIGREVGKLDSQLREKDWLVRSKLRSPFGRPGVSGEAAISWTGGRRAPFIRPPLRTGRRKPRSGPAAKRGGRLFPRRPPGGGGAGGGSVLGWRTTKDELRRTQRILQFN